MQRLTACIRFRAFAADTAQDRARERIRKASLTTLAAMLARAISMLTPLVSVPLTFSYLGLERYGLWQTIASFAGFMAFADLGLGNGIVSQIAQADGRGDRKTIEQTVSTAFYLLCGTALGLLLIYGVVSPTVPWRNVFNVKTPLAMAEAGPAMSCFVVCFLVNLPVSVVQKVQMALQDGFNSYLWACVGSLAGLGMIVAAVRAHLGLPALLLGLMGVPILVTCMNAANYFGWRKPWLMPQWRYVDRNIAGGLLGRGAAFLVISALMSFGMGADNIIAAQMLGADAVAKLALPARMAMPLLAVGQMLYLPMWGANAEAIARGDVAWVRQTLNKLTRLITLFTVMGAVGLVVAGPWAVRWLTGHGMETNSVLLAGLGAWAVLTAVAGPAFMVLNAAHILRPQIYMYSAFLVLGVAAKIWLARYFGIEGVVWAGVVIYLLVVLLPLPGLVAKTLSQLATGNTAPSLEAAPEGV